MMVSAECPQDPDLLRSSVQEEAEEQMELILNREIPDILKKISNKEVEIYMITLTLYKLQYRNESLRYNAACRKETLNRLHLALDKLTFANNAYHDNAIKHSFLRDEEIDYRRMKFKMMHGKKSLQKEKGVLREIRTKKGKDNTTSSWSSLEDGQCSIREIQCAWRGTGMAAGKAGEEDELCRQLKQVEMEMENVIANCVVGGKIWKSLGSRKAIKEQIDAAHKEAEEARVERWRVQVETKRAKESLKCLQEGQSLLHSQLNDFRGKGIQIHGYTKRMDYLWTDELL